MSNPFADLEKGADYTDTKVFEGNKTLREFVAGMVGYEPGWLVALYTLRGGLARILGLRHAEIERSPRLQPEDVGFNPGDLVGFFVTVLGKENEYWAAEASDTHLAAYVCVRAEPLDGGRTRFHTQTIVHYRRWTGPLYFNLIRPFHHLVVKAMGNAAVRG